MAKFVLVHGAGHGAWCWYKVVARLRGAGHSVVAVDLTSAGINTVEANQVRSIGYYARPLVELIEGLPQGDKIVLVGHSLGGIVLTYAMEKYPTKCAAAIFVVASMLPSGPQAIQVRDKAVVSRFKDVSDYFYTPGVEAPTSARLKAEYRQPYLYNLCSAEDIELASVLLKPSPLLPPPEVAVEYTKANYGSVPRFYIKATHDRTMPLEMQEMLLETNPPDEVFEIPSDHSPFFSTPDELVQAFLNIISKFNKP